MFKRRTFRRSRRSSGSPYEMQQLNICRTPLTIDRTATCTQPLQFLTGLVSPRREFGLAGPAAGSELVPAFSKGVTVGGIRFRYCLSVNTELATVGFPNNISDVWEARHALVVLPMADASTELPGVFPTNVLFNSGTIPESNVTAGLGYTRPRILWRGMSLLKFIRSQFKPSGAVDSGDLLWSTAWGGEGTALQVVKSKVSLGHNDALYFLTEVVHGLEIVFPTFSIPLVLDMFGVAAVKPITRTRP